MQETAIFYSFSHNWKSRGVTSANHLYLLPFLSMLLWFMFFCLHFLESFPAFLSRFSQIGSNTPAARVAFREMAYMIPYCKVVVTNTIVWQTVVYKRYLSKIIRVKSSITCNFIASIWVENIENYNCTIDVLNIIKEFIYKSVTYWFKSQIQLDVSQHDCFQVQCTHIIIKRFR